MKDHPLEDPLERAQHERLLKESAVQDYIRAVHESFVADVIDEAGQRLAVESVDIDTIGDALHRLHQEGYRIRQDKDDVLVFAHPDVYHDLRDSVPNYTVDFRSDSTDTVDIHGASVHLDPSIPDGTMIVLHPKATAPNPLTTQTSRPWVVRDADGIVVVEVDT